MSDPRKIMIDAQGAAMRLEVASKLMAEVVHGGIDRVTGGVRVSQAMAQAEKAIKAAQVVRRRLSHGSIPSSNFLATGRNTVHIQGKEARTIRTDEDLKSLFRQPYPEDDE